MRSAVLTGMLARRGVHARVVIGVRPNPNFEAHAWVELGSRPLLATDEATFRRLAEI
jgi:Transglutaminase-like superfamily